MSGKQTYGLSLQKETGAIEAPVLPYRPQDPRAYRPAIGIIGCGGISEQHLRAYKNAGYQVTVLCDLIRARAKKRRDEFFPEAMITTDYRKVLARDDIEVVDVTTHPPERFAIIEESLRAGKHVLSQKPFVLDLKMGERLVDLADKKGVKLAVNQNGRWAPHFSYIRNAIAAGLLGEINSADFAVYWDHNWTAGSRFDRIHHLILYDFAIHWFDIASVFFGSRVAKRVTASISQAKGQRAKPPLLAHAIVDYEDGQATFTFNGSCALGQMDTTTVMGEHGTIHSVGPSLAEQHVTISTHEGTSVPTLEGCWFPDGFHGTMGELLRAIEEGREPTNSARGNLRSLALCFAAVASADSGRPVTPGRVRRIQLD
jgi:predicted dehydrogenase